MVRLLLRLRDKGGGEVGLDVGIGTHYGLAATAVAAADRALGGVAVTCSGGEGSLDSGLVSRHGFPTVAPVHLVNLELTANKAFDEQGQQTVDGWGAREQRGRLCAVLQVCAA